MKEEGAGAGGAEPEKHPVICPQPQSEAGWGGEAVQTGAGLGERVRKPGPTIAAKA